MIHRVTSDIILLQYNFVSCGGMKLAVNMLTKNNFLHNVDLPTKRYVTYALNSCFHKNV